MTWLREAPMPTARADGSEGNIKAAGDLRQVSDHENRDNAEYSRPHPVQIYDTSAMVLEVNV